LFFFAVLVVIGTIIHDHDPQAMTEDIHQSSK